MMRGIVQTRKICLRAKVRFCMRMNPDLDLNSPCPEKNMTESVFDNRGGNENL
jgi:hypothetical protein